MSVQKLHDERLVLGVTTSVLFDMSEADAHFRRYGIDGYRAYMKERMDEPLKTGAFFEWVQDFAQQPHHDIVLFSRNSAITALRAVKTLAQHDIIPRRFVFTNGINPTSYLHSYKIDHYCSTNEQDVLRSRRMGVSSAWFEHPEKVDLNRLPQGDTKKATIIPMKKEKEQEGNVVTLSNKLKKAAQRQHYIFDFDGVVAGDSSEEYYKDYGLDAFQQLEKSNIRAPMEKGPAFSFFKKISEMGQKAPSGSPYLVSMVTARGVYAAIRCLHSLAHWNIEPNGEIHCMSGADKGPILRILKENYGQSAIFFDDGEKNIESAREHGVLAGRILTPPKDEKTLG